jgi:hypothetical protein
MGNLLRDQLIVTTKNFFFLLEESDIDKWIELWAEDSIDKKPYATGMFPEEVIGKKISIMLGKVFSNYLIV